jgi:acetylornithine deacetylase/succinyl-diaminopimelate desuccinylase-like protein
VIRPLLFFTCLAVFADNPAASAARAWRETHEREILREFLDLLAIPNIAADAVNIRRNAAAIQAIMERRGVATQLLEIPGAPPVVFGEIKTPGASRTVVFYAHYDGQPLNPREWATDPWKPVVRDAPLDRDGRIVELPASGAVNPEWRIYARSASDDKAPVIAIAAALDALKAARIPLKWNIKFVFEGEEEAGSAHLGQILEKHRDLIASDVWLICDGPVHQSRQQQIVFGARGVVTVDLTVYGPKRELHSGHYGNWAPNPAFMMARLLASMKDDEGRITIPGFAAGIEPLGPAERRALAEVPPTDRDLMRELNLGRSENPGRTLAELITTPSLNVRGMSAARTGAQASNVIPSTANATIDMRLVKGITAAVAVSRLREHIHQQG